MKEIYREKIYKIGNIIAANLSNDVAEDLPNEVLHYIGPRLYYEFHKFLDSHKRCGALSLVFAIENELSAFQRIIDDCELKSEWLDVFKEKLRLFWDYTSWESEEMLVECAYNLFGTEWEVKSIGSD